LGYSTISERAAIPSGRRPPFICLPQPRFQSILRIVFASAADELGHRTRVKLFRLAFDAAVSSFSGRQQLYDRYYSGDPVRLAGTLYGLYNKDTHIDRIFGLLDELEARQNAG
jgi:aromatic ring hydroxylase